MMQKNKAFTYKLDMTNAASHVYNVMEVDVGNCKIRQDKIRPKSIILSNSCGS